MKKPLQFSCRKPVPAPKPKVYLVRGRETPRDPRFDSLSGGSFDAEKCAQAYSFIDEIVAQEKKLLNKLKKKKGGEDAEKIIQKIDSQQLARKIKTEKKSVIKELRKTEIDLVANKGKKPYFHPKSVVRAKLEENMSGSQKDKSFIKKSKKILSKEKKSEKFPKIRRVVASETV